MTYPRAVGPAQARQTGEGLVAEAAALAEGLGPAAWPLKDLAVYIMQRTH
jgi:hypothetical protein